MKNPQNLLQCPPVPTSPAIPKKYFDIDYSVLDIKPKTTREVFLTYVKQKDLIKKLKVELGIIEREYEEEKNK
jgi:hypothetical protein